MKYNYAFNAVRFKDGTLLVSLLPDVRTEYAGVQITGGFEYAWRSHDTGEFTDVSIPAQLVGDPVLQSLKVFLRCWEAYAKALAVEVMDSEYRSINIEGMSIKDLLRAVGDNTDGEFCSDSWYSYEVVFPEEEMQERLKQKDLRVAAKLEDAKKAFLDYVKLLALLGLSEEEILNAKGVPEVLVSEVKSSECLVLLY